MEQNQKMLSNRDNSKKTYKVVHIMKSIHDFYLPKNETKKKISIIKIMIARFSIMEQLKIDRDAERSVCAHLPWTNSRSQITHSLESWEFQFVCIYGHFDLLFKVIARALIPCILLLLLLPPLYSFLKVWGQKKKKYKTQGNKCHEMSE